MNITIVGAGRAGSSFALALSRAGHRVDLVHHDDAIALDDARVVLLCVPDGEVAATAAGLAPSASRVRPQARSAARARSRRSRGDASVSSSSTRFQKSSWGTPPTGPVS